jgi:hypothetical protein
MKYYCPECHSSWAQKLPLNICQICTGKLFTADQLIQKLEQDSKQLEAEKAMLVEFAQEISDIDVTKCGPLYPIIIRDAAKHVLEKVRK